MTPTAHREHQALAKDLGGVPASPDVWDDAVANVTTVGLQVVVQLVPDRGTADQFAVDPSQQERCRNLTRA